jgi:hypothetical protein
MKVVLTRKYAERIDGVDLSESKVGDVLELTRTDAVALLAEGWALPERRNRAQSNGQSRRAADDRQS